MIKSEASSSAEPPISPIMIIDSVSGSFKNNSRQSIKFVPLIGSPPIPIHVDCPMPFSVVCATASYVKVPDLETIPTFPFLCISPGIIPILHSPGVIIPGQLGPINLLLLFLRRFFTFTISRTGTPSVIQTMRSISASIASIIADAANFAGTYIIVAVAPVLFIASFTVSNTGRFKCFCPPFFGVTPPTNCVPYFIACSE